MTREGTEPGDPVSAQDRGEPADDSPPPAVDPLDSPDAGARVIRGGVIRGIAYAVNILLITATVPLMTRHLGVVDFGRFVTASSIVMIVAGVTEFGLTGVATREYALADAAERRRLLGNVIGLRTLATLLGLTIAFLLMLSGGSPGVVLVGILISGAGLMLINVQQTLALVLSTSLRWGLYSLFELVNTLVVAIGTVVLVLLGTGLLPFFYVSVISSLAALAATLLVMRSHVMLRPRFEVQAWVRLLRDSIPYAAATTVGILYFRVALIVVSLGSGAEQTGYYSTAFKVVEAISGTAFLMASSAFPIFARAGRDDHERLRYGSGRVSETALIAGVYLALSLVVAAPFVIEVLAGASFKPAVPVLRLQATSLIATFLGATWSLTLLSLREHRRMLQANALALALAVILSLALVPSLGAEGAAMATAATEFVLAGAYWWSLGRSPAKFRPSLGLLPKVLVAAALAGAPALVLSISSFVLWAIASAIYLAVLLLLRAFPPELLHALLRRDAPVVP
jgi:O-antigen/teichoic acid export membrane protein